MSKIQGKPSALKTEHPASVADPDPEPFCSVSDPYSFFLDPDPDPEIEAGDQYGSGYGSNPDPWL